MNFISRLLPKKRKHERWSLKLPRKLNKKKIWRLLLYGVGAIVLFIVLLFAWYAKDLPTPEKLAARKATESTKIFDRNGNLLYTTGEKRRSVIDAKDMPQSIRQATVAIEDKDFYKHHGLNFKGIIRAVVADVTSGTRAQGGSTITQQFVKNALLSPKKTFTRKIKEAILSIELEQTKSKDEILTLYLNEIPYGGNVYGVQEASKMFFGKDAKDLTLSEAATLAALPQSPTYYSPYGSHTDALFARKNKVLKNMVEMGYITEKQAEDAKNDAPNSKDKKFAKRQENIKAPHFVMFVRERLVDLYGEQLVNEGGLQVTTTLDGELQDMSQEAIAAGTPKISSYGASNAALVSVDPKTGQILSMVGSKDYFDTENDGNVNVTIADRQPGSSFKPIAYATAFKKQYNPATTLFDLKTDFDGYTPENYDGKTRGPVSARYALANSLNIPAVKILSLAGVKNTIDTAKDLGITTLTDPNRYGLALVLGGGEVKPLEMAGAYATFANGGNRAAVTPFLNIKDSTGKTLFEFKQGQNVKTAIDPQIAYEITSILSDNGVRSDIFGNSLVVPGYNVAVKTGTTQEFRDAWTCGATPNLSTVVWVGNNDNTKMRRGADGSVVAAPIFRNYMEKALSKIGAKEDFQKPSGIQEVTVEKFSNKLPTSHSQQLVKDIFASWQVPTEKDNVNIVVRVNKSNGLLATDSTPESLVEERVYRDIHSERPDYPNWEDPVRAWAAANGFVGKPPSSKDDSYDGKMPTVSITSPSNGKSYLAGSTVSVTANASASNGVREVKFQLGSTATTDTGSPWGASFNTSGWPAGDYKLTATVYDSNGVSASSQITITITPSTHTQSNIRASNITGSSAIVSVETNVPTTAQVFYGTDSGSLSEVKNDSFNSSSHSITLSGLSSGKTYYYKVRTQAGSSIVTSSVRSFTTL